MIYNQQSGDVAGGDVHTLETYVYITVDLVIFVCLNFRKFSSVALL